MSSSWLQFAWFFFCSFLAFSPVYSQSMADAAIQARSKKDNENKNSSQPSQSSAGNSNNSNRSSSSASTDRSRSFADAAIDAQRMRSQPQPQSPLLNVPSLNNPSQGYRPNAYAYQRCPLCNRYPYQCRCTELQNRSRNYGTSNSGFNNALPLNLMPPLQPILPPAAVNAAPIVPPQPSRIALKVAGYRRSNEASRKRADRLLEEGDELFNQQNYTRARLRYTEAINAAQDYAIAHFRQAHVLFALERYDEASDEYLIVLELAGGVLPPRMNVEVLYAQEPDLLASQIARLEKRLQRDPRDGRLAMLAAMTHHSFHQEELAEPHFQHAASIPGDWVNYAKRLLNQ